MKQRAATAAAAAGSGGGAAAARGPAPPLLLTRRDLLPAELPAPGSADAATATLLAALLGYRPWALGLGVPTAVLDALAPDASSDGGPPTDGCHVWDPDAPGPFDAAAAALASSLPSTAAAASGGGSQRRSASSSSSSSSASSSAPHRWWYKVAWAGYSRQLHATWVPREALTYAHPGALHAVLVEAVVSKGARLWHPAAAGGVRALSAGGLVALDDDEDDDADADQNGGDSDNGGGGGRSAGAGATAGTKRKRGAAGEGADGASTATPASSHSRQQQRSPCLPFSVADRGDEVLEEVDDDQAPQMEAWGLTPGALAAATVDALRYRPRVLPQAAAAGGAGRGKPAAGASATGAKALEAAIAGCPWWAPRYQGSSGTSGAAAAAAKTRAKPAAAAAASSDTDGDDDSDLRLSDDEDDGRDPWDRAAPSGTTLKEAAAQWAR
jgi:hypothetical protein